MSESSTRRPIFGVAAAVLVGVVGGLLALALANSNLGTGGTNIDRSGQLSIHINGVSQRMARDVFLPTEGWVLQIRYPDLPIAEEREGFVVILRSERTGATIEIQDRFRFEGEFATLIVPEQLGLTSGLLSVRASFDDEAGKRFEASRRIRIRSPLGLLPIGFRQVIHFDFRVDHDGDGRPDFWNDLELFGLASTRHPDLARSVAAQIEERALLRVEAAYDPGHDPNLTGRTRDFATVRFRPDSNPGSLITRICVGGRDPTERDRVGHVRLDFRNEDKTSLECSRNPAAGLFPAALDTHRDSTLFREVLDPFLPDRGGRPIGEHPDDSLERLVALFEAGRDGQTSSARETKIIRAIEVLGTVLGSIMAHEAGHALGLVAEGRPSVGLFGGSDGASFAHNIDSHGEEPTSNWLMNSGGSLGFEELAGEGKTGPLIFRPLNFAYLRDRVIVTD